MAQRWVGRLKRWPNASRARPLDGNFSRLLADGVSDKAKRDQDMVTSRSQRLPLVRQTRNFLGATLDTSKSLLRLESSTSRIEAIHRAERRSPIDQYLSMSYAMRTDGLFDGSYDLWRAKRIAKVLELLGLDYFEGRRVLELGAGHGDIGALFADLGADVTCVEGRMSNLQFGQLKHRDVPRLRFRHMDLDEDFRSLGRYDLVVHFGLLYHVADVDEHLARCFELTDDVLLETVVCDSTDPTRVQLVEERSAVNEEALNGRGCRPSPFYVERLASEHGFGVERHFSPDLNSAQFVYDWEHRNDDRDGGFELRRFWRFRRSE